MTKGIAAQWIAQARDAVIPAKSRHDSISFFVSERISWAKAPTAIDDSGGNFMSKGNFMFKLS